MPKQPNPIRRGGRGVASGRNATSGGEALVVMVQATDLGEGDNPARAAWALASDHAQLMAEGDDLQFQRGSATKAEGQQG